MKTKEREAVVDYLNTFTPMLGKFRVGIGAVTYDRLPTRVVVGEYTLKRLFLSTKKWVDAAQEVTKCRCILDENLAAVNEIVMRKALENVTKAKDYKETL